MNKFRQYIQSITITLLISGVSLNVVYSAVLDLGELIEEDSSHKSHNHDVDSLSALGNMVAGIVNISVINADSISTSPFGLRIEITDMVTGNVVNKLAGSYEYRPGTYKIRIFRINPDTNKPYSAYQIIEDEITVLSKGKVTRKYSLPRRREILVTTYLATLWLSTAFVPDSYEVSNPEKEHFDKLSIANVLPSTVPLSDASFSGETQMGYAFSLAYFPPSWWMAEVEQFGVFGSNLSRFGLSFGSGAYHRSKNALTWMSVSIGGEDATWRSLNYRSSFGDTKLNNTLRKFLLYLKLAQVRTSSGLSYSVQYDPLNAVVSANVGWSFVRDKKWMPLAETVSFKESH